MRPWLCCLLLVGCGAPPCPLDEALAAELPGATDCGVVPIDGDRTAVDACVVAAFEAGEPFYAIYELQGMDSQVRQAIGGDGSTVSTYLWDSDPSGGSGAPATLDRSACGTATVTDGALVCEDPGESERICGR